MTDKNKTIHDSEKSASVNQETINNREFVIVIEATMCNPNGDLDTENRPRMNNVSSELLVSEVRRKRDCREFWKSRGLPIFVERREEPVDLNQRVFEILEEFKKDMDNKKDKNNEEEGKWNHIDPDTRQKMYLTLEKFTKALEEAKKKKNKTQKNSKISSSDESSDEDNKIKFNLTEEEKLIFRDFITQYFCDVRIFGQLLAISNYNLRIVGPVQMLWGRSLHPVDLVDSTAVTSAFKSSENNTASTIGRKYQVYYSLYAHYGIISGENAKDAGMNPSDVDLFREALIRGVSENITSTKFGQVPMLYIEVEHEDKIILGDLTRFIKVEYDAPRGYNVRSYKDIKKIDISELIEVLEDIKDKVVVHIWYHPVLKKLHKELVEQVNQLPNADWINIGASNQTE